MEKEYHADVAYGTQRWVKVQASGWRKGVYCNNYFAEIMKLLSFVQERIIATHPAEALATKPVRIDPKDAESEFVD